VHIENLFKKLSNNRPNLIYLSGKTCTGKSTFARRLQDQLGYASIELDNIVKDCIIKPFHLEDQEGTVFVEVYRNGQNQQWLQAFVQGTRHLIDQNLTKHQPLVIDGAVANSKTLAAIFEGHDFTFVYFHPQILDNYVRNLTARFMSSSTNFSAGLPKRFWPYIDAKEFEKFSSSRHLTPSIEYSIKQYARSSQAESVQRQLEFQAHFDNVVVVQI